MLLKSHVAGQVCVQKENESHKKEIEFACLRKELFPQPVLYFARMGTVPEGKRHLENLPRHSWNVVFPCEVMLCICS